MFGEGESRGWRNGVAIAALAAAALGAPGLALADTASEIKALKAQLKRLETKLDAQSKATHEATKHLDSTKSAPAASAPPPVFVSFKNGLYVESEDKSFDFKIGGRIHADGGFASSADTIRRSNAGFRRAELEVAGRAYGNWIYRFQYDFATAAGGVVGIRDAYLAYRAKFLPEWISAQPVSLQIGNFHEPFGREVLDGDKHMTFMERSLTANLGPARHIGAAIGVGDASWALKGGIFSTSPQDAASAPPVGGAQYWDASARAVYTPIHQEDALLHLGAAFVYHRPNSATGATDATNLTPGASAFERELTGILGAGGATARVPAAQDLSCAASAASLNVVTTGAGQLVAPFVQRPSCLKYSYNYGFEAAAALGPVSVEAEYVGAQYERDALLAFLYANGGGSRLHYSAYHVAASLFLTGESRAASYDGYDKNWSSPGTYSDVKIKNPLGKGGYGAVEVAARYEGIDLNNGGLVPASFVYLATAAGSAAQKAIANTATLGGRQENVTVALNWYPVRGVRLQANWTRAMTLIAPSDRAFLNGDHPSLFLARAQVFW
ncbi:MAG TPA: porin [Methylosinus sp.]|jgi:phosphate-selective porin OprO/OprP|uniref:OprO/OprP family phosphate-selective porin n=1 Tax=Methylosinus sp. TaxID=427 RepID=UPI002F95087B